MRIRAYIDEDVPFSFAQALSNHDVDVVTTQQAGDNGVSNVEQLQYAAKEGGGIFMHNKRDFRSLHNEYLRAEKDHSGMVMSDQLPIGTMLRRFMKLWFALGAIDMKNRLDFLSNW